MADWHFSALKSSFKKADCEDYMMQRASVNTGNHMGVQLYGGSWPWFPKQALKPKDVLMQNEGLRGAWEYSAKRCKRGMPAGFGGHRKGLSREAIRTRSLVSMGYANGPYTKVRGMRFKAKAINSLEMSLPARGCKSQATWSMRICAGCGCKKGQVLATLKHTLSAGKPRTCGDWFAATDMFIHSYIANVRAALLVEKELLCIKASNHKKAKKQKKGGSKRVVTKKPFMGVPAGYTDVTQKYLSQITAA